MAFDTSRQSQHKFKLDLQYLEMVRNQKYFWITIDSRPGFARHVTETKHKLQIPHQNMIKAITNLKIGVNIKTLMTPYMSLVESAITFAAPIFLLACDSALQPLERIKRTLLRYIFGLSNEASSILVYGQSGINHPHL